MIRTVTFILFVFSLGLLACSGPDGSEDVPDTQNPEVSITSSTTSNTASYTLTATATDDVGVNALSYTLNGDAPQPISPVVSPLSVALTLEEGDNNITVTAEDADGNEGSDQITVSYSTDADPDPDPEEPGKLEVFIGGLPEDEDAAITVTVPGVYTQNVTETTTLNGLSPADYSVEAAKVTIGSVSYIPDPPHQQVIVEGTKTASADIQYKQQNSEDGSNLMLTIKGLPAGEAAGVRVDGPSGFSINLTRSLTLFDMPPGDFTISANEVTVAGESYVPSPATQSATLTLGTTAEVTVTYATPETATADKQSWLNLEMR